MQKFVHCKFIQLERRIMQSVDGQENHVPHIKTTQTSALLRVSHDFHIAHHRASQFLFKLAAALKSNIIKNQLTLQLITSEGTCRNVHRFPFSDILLHSDWILQMAQGWLYAEVTCFMWCPYFHTGSSHYLANSRWWNSGKVEKFQLYTRNQPSYKESL